MDAKIKKHILIIEDNFINMKLIARVLESKGYNTIKAYDGSSSLEFLKDTTPDLILLDIHLPDIDGFELFKKIREDERSKDVKVIAVTASAMKKAEIP